jgi:hypothetical protein
MAKFLWDIFPFFSDNNPHLQLCTLLPISGQLTISEQLHVSILFSCLCCIFGGGVGGDLGLEIEFSASHMLNTNSTTELYPNPPLSFVSYPIPVGADILNGDGQTVSVELQSALHMPGFCILRFNQLQIENKQKPLHLYWTHADFFLVIIP